MCPLVLGGHIQLNKMKKPLIISVSLAIIVATMIAQVTPPNYPYAKPKPTNGLNTAPGQTKVSQSLGQSAFSNPEPVIWARDVAGGLQSVTNEAERLSLPLVIEGEIVYDAATKRYYSVGTDLKATIPLFGQDESTFYLSDGNIVTPNGIRTVYMGTNSLHFAGGSNFALDVANALHLFSYNYIDLRAPNDINFFAGHANFYGTNSAHILTAGTLALEAGFPLTTTRRVRQPRLPGATLILDSFGGMEITSVNDVSTLFGANDIKEVPFGYSSLQSPDIRIRTAEVIAGTATVGQALVLVNANGKVGYSTISGGGGGSGATVGASTWTTNLFNITSPTPGYVVTTDYPDFFAVDMKPDRDSAGTSSLKVGSGPIKTIKTPNLSIIYPGDIVSNSVARLVFSATSDAFILNNPASTLAFDSATLSANTTNGVTTIAVIGGGSGGGNTIYTGDGAITVNRTVTITNNAILLFDGINKGGTFRVSADLSRTAGKTNMTLGTEEIWLGATGASARMMMTTPSTYAGTAVVGDVLQTTVVGGGNAYVDFKPYTNYGPMFIMKRGVLRRNFQNIMFDINSWGLTSTLQDTAFWLGNVGGTPTPAASGIGGIAGHTGINSFKTSVATNSFQLPSMRGDAIQFEAGNKLFMFARVRIPVLSVNGGEAFRAAIGFGDRNTSALLDTDCITITYNDFENTGKWQLDCAEAGAHLYTDSGITVNNTLWYDLEIEATTTLVRWWINDVEMPQVSTAANIPDGANKFTPMLGVTSYNGGGAVEKAIYMDSYHATGVYTY